jgi:hypothetical protein
MARVTVCHSYEEVEHRYQEHTTPLITDTTTQHYTPSEQTSL